MFADDLDALDRKYSELSRTDGQRLAEGYRTLRADGAETRPHRQINPNKVRPLKRRAAPKERTL